MPTNSVFDAVRRGYDELDSHSIQDIQTYFDAISLDDISPSVADIDRWSDSDIALEAQLKAADSPVIMASVLASVMGSASVTDTGINIPQLIKLADTAMSGMEALSLEDSADIISEASTELVAEVASEGIFEAVADVALPVSPLGILGLLFGLPF